MGKSDFCVVFFLVIGLLVGYVKCAGKYKKLLLINLFILNFGSKSSLNRENEQSSRSISDTRNFFYFILVQHPFRNKMLCYFVFFFKFTFEFGKYIGLL